MVLGLNVFAVSINISSRNLRKSTDANNNITIIKHKIHLNLRRRIMKKMLAAVIMAALLLVGCDSLRFAPTEVQKQNAWLHNRTTTVAADTAKVEGASEKLCDLTKLSQLQSRSFTSYFGLPKEFPQADTAEQILAESNVQIADTALQQSGQRPAVFDVANNVLDLAIGIFAVLGGVYGTKTVAFLKQAKVKSKALQEVIAGNELFKKLNSESADAFKEAQSSQSPQTKQIVAGMKG
jgi:hypothetical protein